MLRLYFYHNFPPIIYFYYTFFLFIFICQGIHEPWLEAVIAHGVSTLTYVDVRRPGDTFDLVPTKNKKDLVDKSNGRCLRGHWVRIFIVRGCESATRSGGNPLV